MWSSCSSKIKPSNYKFVLALRTYVTNCYIKEYLLKGSGRCVLAENFAKMKPIYHKSCKSLRKAAVLLPLCIVNNELSILFTRRSPILSSYGGQVSLPGGKQDDKDSSPEETALREVYEELGILPESIEIFATSNHSIPDRTGKYSVWLVIGYLGHISLQDLTPNPFEVKEVFCVSLTQLLNESLYGYTKFKNKWVLPVYKNNYHNVWGLTAIFVDIFLSQTFPHMYKQITVRGEAK
ncbi:nudix hydrolase 3-like [Hydra vulgaris]|uniref:Nudix hydrolase 3-like n=1 Tax=Hydra vulgaris TaxID=6087 RepID=A0ABM4C341_HYDVU